jgi:hypothetical protein
MQLQYTAMLRWLQQVHQLLQQQQLLLNALAPAVVVMSSHC